MAHEENTAEQDMHALLTSHYRVIGYLPIDTCVDECNNSNVRLMPTTLFFQK